MRVRVGLTLRLQTPLHNFIRMSPREPKQLKSNSIMNIIIVIVMIIYPKQGLQAFDCFVGPNLTWPGDDGRDLELKTRVDRHQVNDLSLSFCVFCEFPPFLACFPRVKMGYFAACSI